MNFHIFVSIFILAYVSLGNSFYFSDLNEISCKDETTGLALDWFTLYKLPKLTEIEEYSTVNNPFINEGTAYTYLTNDVPEWQLSSLSMNNTNSFAGKTLAPLYSNKFDETSSIGYILYNDQADKVTLEKGHTKGVILFNENTAVWIVHSIPHFPPRPGMNYSINPSQCVYGQSMICMSLNVTELAKIGQQLKFTWPQVYDYFMPQFVHEFDHFANLIDVIGGEHVRQAPWSNLNLIQTLGGEQMMSFAKFTDFEDDLYTVLVAPFFESNLLTETWNNGAGTLESNCTNSFNFQVHNIEEINFKGFSFRFSVHHDHSKWAVTTNKVYNRNRDLGVYTQSACIGDINRQEEQFKRGGGTVCFLNNPQVWEQYSELVSQIEPCKRKQFKRAVPKMQSKITQGRRIKFPGSKDKIVMLG